jgi:hypothetical protein
MNNWKLLRVWFNDNDVATYSTVAGVRIDGDFLVIRQGAFPDEVITRIKLKKVKSYTVENG